jgi:hypothetical protein
LNGNENGLEKACTKINPWQPALLLLCVALLQEQLRQRAGEHPKGWQLLIWNGIILLEFCFLYPEEIEEAATEFLLGGWAVEDFKSTGGVADSFQEG